MNLDAETLGLAAGAFATVFAYLAARGRVKARGAQSSGRASSTRPRRGAGHALAAGHATAPRLGREQG